MQQQITISNSFFAKAKNDYANWSWALIREFMQNSMDAPGCDRIDVRISRDANGTVLAVSNNGKPMCRDTLLNNLLSLGGSGKDGVTSVGGFGKAKELLYFCHKSYVIATGDIAVVGSGPGYTLHNACDWHDTSSALHVGLQAALANVCSQCGGIVGELVGFLNATTDICIGSGTHSVVFVDGCPDDLGDLARNFVRCAQWHGKVRIVVRDEGDIKSDMVYKCDLAKGSRRREFDWGVVYSNKSGDGVLVARVNGIPMFVKNVAGDRCIVVELKNSKVLTSNRDGLTWTHARELDSFVRLLSTDVRMALRNIEKEVFYPGKSFTTSPFTAEIPVDQGDRVNDDLSDARIAALSSIDAASGSGCVVNVVRKSVLDFGFVVKNTTDLKIPKCYLPDGEFSTYSRRLTMTWVKLLFELYRMHDVESKFRVGFVFGDEYTALCGRAHDSELVYYINPCNIVKQTNGSRSFSRRWSFNSADKKELLVVAIHEFAHGIGNMHHDENWGIAFTAAITKCLGDLSRFNHCFAV